MAKTIDDIIQKYYAEAVKGIQTDKVPSELNRGEGVDAEYYIFKIDICNSTILLARRPSQTYLKIAHVFLSTIDEITREYGADTKQVEYAGDSVLAYFPNYNGMAMKVLLAAYFSRMAALKMKTLDTTFNTFPFKTKVVLHYSKLILGKIGPWGDHNLTAIGHPIHYVAKLEKDVPPGNGLVTIKFAEKLSSTEKRYFLNPNYIDKKIEIQKTEQGVLSQPATGRNTLAGMLGYQPAIGGRGLLDIAAYATAETRKNALASLLVPSSTIANVEPQYKIEKELVNYSVKWDNIALFLQGKLKI
jgi:class 3 adenylate cyclase